MSSDPYERLMYGCFCYAFFLPIVICLFIGASGQYQEAWDQYQLDQRFRHDGQIITATILNKATWCDPPKAHPCHRRLQFLVEGETHRVFVFKKSLFNAMAVGDNIKMYWLPDTFEEFQVIDDRREYLNKLLWAVLISGLGLFIGTLLIGILPRQWFQRS